MNGAVAVALVAALVSAGGGFLAAARPGPRLDAQIVLDVSHSRNGVGAVFGPPLGQTAINRARERHFAIGDLHLDLGRVKFGVVGEPIVDVVANAIIGPCVVLGPTAGMLAPLLAPTAGEVALLPSHSRRS